MLLHLLLQFALPSLAATFTVTSSISTYAPVATSALGPTIPKALGYRIESFGKGAYMVTDGGYQAMFLVAGQSVIVVDAPPSLGYKMIYAIRNVTDLPISHVIYSHAHADHIGAAFIYGDPMSLTIIAHEQTATYLALAPDYNHRPAPTITFESTYTLYVGNQTLQLDYRGPNHEPGNIFIYAPAQKVLMLVDIVYPKWTPFNLLGEVENVPGYIRAHDQILTYDFKHYVGGHLNVAGTREDVQLARDYIHDLYNTSLLAINLSAQPDNAISESSVIGPEATKTDPNNFFAVNAYYVDVLSDWVTENLAPRWNTTFAALDVYGKSHAAAMLESLRLDFGILGPFAIQPA